MAQVTYHVQRPGEGPVMLNACRDLVNATPFDRITGLYAFASFKGARLLVAAASSSPSWTRAQKRWIISIDGGITEPSALRFLLSLRRSEVRVHDAEALLTRRLRPIYRFHPKTLLLENQIAPPTPAGILVGSANMTFNGLCFGYEHALRVVAAGANPADAIPQSMVDGLRELESAINTATAIDSGFVDRYEAIRPARPKLPPEPEDKRADQILQDQAVIPATQAAALAAADHFWIDNEYVVENRGQNNEGNQIDMQRGTRVFFGFGDAKLPKNSPIGSIRILYQANSAMRNLRFGNNSMDKLDLPIPILEGPPTYLNQTLLFTRETPTSFRLTVGDTAQIAAWKTKSRAAGTLFRMQSGREFGVF